MAQYRQARVGGCIEATVDRRADGSLLLRSVEPLGAFPARLTDALEHWAATAPDRVFAARREGTGDWRTISYAQMLRRAQSLGQALLDLGLGPECPLAILSGNDLEHLSLMLGAMWAGVPVAPISPAYALMSQDFGKLRHIAGVLTPGAVFAADAAFACAIAAVLPSDLPVILGRGRLDSRESLAFDALLDTAPTPALAAPQAAGGPATVATIHLT